MVNFYAIGTATIAGFLFGWIWYGPAFGKQWMALTGITKKDAAKAPASAMLIAVLTQLITVLVLAYLIQLTGSMSAMGGATIGFLVWLGFVATNSLGGVLWEFRPINLWVFNNTYSLLVLLGSGAILGAW